MRLLRSDWRSRPLMGGGWVACRLLPTLCACSLASLPGLLEGVFFQAFDPAFGVWRLGLGSAAVARGHTRSRRLPLGGVLCLTESILPLDVLSFTENGCPLDPDLTENHQQRPRRADVCLGWRVVLVLAPTRPPVDRCPKTSSRPAEAAPCAFRRPVTRHSQTCSSHCCFAVPPISQRLRK